MAKIIITMMTVDSGIKYMDVFPAIGEVIGLCGVLGVGEVGNELTKMQFPGY